MKRLFKPFKIFFLGALLASFSNVDAKSLDELLDKPERPTMHQTKAYLSLIKEESGIPAQAERPPGVAQWTEVLIEYGPRLIAAMEASYPGATWAFIGRDCHAWADLFEAFYASLGQRDRVRRLEISSPTVASIQQDPEMLMDYLKQKGLNLKDLKKSFPFIFVDTISKNYGRQARTLLSTVLARYMEQNARKSETDLSGILGQVNIFGLMVSTFQGAQNPYQDVKAFLQNEAVQLQGSDQASLFQQLKILTYPQQPQAANEAGYQHFTFSWHEAYGTLSRKANGQVEGSAGAPSAVPVKKTILWTQKQIWEQVSTPGFLKRVLFHAAQEGYAFPLNRPAPGTELVESLLKDWSASAVLEIMRGTDERVEQRARNAEFQQRFSQALAGLDPPQVSPGVPVAVGSRRLRGHVMQPQQQGVLNILGGFSQSESPEVTAYASERIILAAWEKNLMSDAEVIAALETMINGSEPSQSLLNALKSFGRKFPTLRQYLEAPVAEKDAETTLGLMRRFMQGRLRDESSLNECEEKLKPERS